MGSDCGEGAIGIGWTILGMGLCVIASVGSTIGLILQKLAHTKQEVLSDDEKWPEYNGIICAPYWVIGLVLLVAVPFPLDLVAFTLAPQSLVVPLTGVTLVLNQVLAPWMLNEKLTRLDWIATGVICVGIVCATAFGSHCSYTYTLQQMVNLFEETIFIVCEVAWLIMCAFCTFWVMGGAERFADDQGAINRSRSVAFAVLSGSVGGQQQIFLKATGEMIEASLDDRGEWDRFEPYMFILGCAVFAVGQIVLLNKGLVLWTAVKYLPIYNVALILCSTTFGGVFYKEMESLDTTGLIMFPLGVAIVVIGSMILALKQDGQVEATDEEPKDSDAFASVKIEELNETNPASPKCIDSDEKYTPESTPQSSVGSPIEKIDAAAPDTKELADSQSEQELATKVNPSDATGSTLAIDCEGKHVPVLREAAAPAGSTIQDSPCNKNQPLDKKVLPPLEHTPRTP